MSTSIASVALATVPASFSGLNLVSGYSGRAKVNAASFSGTYSTYLPRSTFMDSVALVHSSFIWELGRSLSKDSAGEYSSRVSDVFSKQNSVALGHGPSAQNGPTYARCQTAQANANSLMIIPLWQQDRDKADINTHVSAQLRAVARFLQHIPPLNFEPRKGSGVCWIGLPFDPPLQTTVKKRLQIFKNHRNRNLAPMR